MTVLVQQRPGWRTGSPELSHRTEEDYLSSGWLVWFSLWETFTVVYPWGQRSQCVDVQQSRLCWRICRKIEMIRFDYWSESVGSDLCPLCYITRRNSAEASAGDEQVDSFRQILLTWFHFSNSAAFPSVFITLCCGLMWNLLVCLRTIWSCLMLLFILTANTPLRCQSINQRKHKKTNRTEPKN